MVALVVIRRNGKPLCLYTAVPITVYRLLDRELRAIARLIYDIADQGPHEFLRNIEPMHESLCVPVTVRSIPLTSRWSAAAACQSAHAAADEWGWWSPAALCHSIPVDLDLDLKLSRKGGGAAAVEVEVTRPPCGVASSGPRG
ncbi:hypothetical protein EVAR_81737_1 [Eumeta japonica]|uniref:Uncharacterized protein n=1 Tax=Eumeta variegata TaxID=151549 RepID=A0A4C1UIT7_EUMVA|nr:hypothetical protein EVAR_81737_1 [Eumeta japonica]